ncbi:MAG: DUF4837 family protein [Prevotella sp.]
MILALLLLALAACKETNVGKPNSIGEPYDVTLMATDNALRTTTTGMLGVEMEGLPQQEHLFNVTIAKGSHIDATTRYNRTIVVVRHAGDHTKIRYEKNPYARNQLLISVTTPSQRVFRTDSVKVAKALRRLIEQFEMNLAMDYDIQNHNLKSMKEVEKAIGCKINIPADIKASKTGKDFIWMSDNGEKTMRNICVYAVSGIRTSQSEIIKMRDSVMSANIKGEHEGMAMATEHRADVMFSQYGKGIVARGLWQMKGDAMGGPFVSITMTDSARNRTVTAEAFIYAPSTSKAKTMKRLEASIYTLKIE